MYWIKIIETMAILGVQVEEIVSLKMQGYISSSQQKSESL